MSESKSLEPKENKRRKLPFGHFKIMVGSEEVVVKPLSQESIADGWQLNLPSYHKSQPVHHWSVTLAQLPPQLWKKLKVDYKDGKEYNPIIKDSIYYYSINSTKHDDDLKNLYFELQKGYNAKVDTIKNLLKDIDNNINGWLIIRARRFVKESIADRYFQDLL